MTWRQALSLSILAALNGCVLDVAITDPDPYFKTNVQLSSDEIHEWRLINLAPYKDVLYVRPYNDQSFVAPFTGGLPSSVSTLKGRPTTWIESEGDFERFLIASLENIDYFESVEFIDDTDIQSMIDAGNSLVAEYFVDWSGGYDYKFYFRVIEPSTGENLLYVSHYHYRMWPRLDRPLFNPVFNAVIDWKNECVGEYDVLSKPK